MSRSSACLFDIYFNGARHPEFFAASKEAWEISVVDVLREMEACLRGPFFCGDQIVNVSTFTRWSSLCC